jgi:hypothetical protein
MANRRVTNPSKTPSDAPKDVFMSPSSEAAWLEEVSLNLFIFFIFLWHTFLSCNLQNLQKTLFFFIRYITSVNIAGSFISISLYCPHKVTIFA